METNRVIVTGDNTVEVVSVGIQGPSGASASFNDTEGDPAAVGTAAAADGTSSNAARRDHKHAINTTELDARYSQVGHAHAESDVTRFTAALAVKEPTIAAGTTSQYWRGDKS